MVLSNFFADEYVYGYVGKPLQVDSQLFLFNTEANKD